MARPQKNGEIILNTCYFGVAMAFALGLQLILPGPALGAAPARGISAPVASPLAAGPARRSHSPEQGSNSCSEEVSNGDFSQGDADWQFSGNVTFNQSCPDDWDCAALGGVADSLAIMTQTVSLPANVASTTLNFNFNLTTDEPPAAGTVDTLSVNVVSASGTPISTVLSFDNTATLGWYPWTYDLTSYQGQTVSLQFAALNTDALDSTLFYLNDVSITSCTGVFLPLILH